MSISFAPALLGVLAFAATVLVAVSLGSAFIILVALAHQVRSRPEVDGAKAGKWPLGDAPKALLHEESPDGQDRREEAWRALTHDLMHSVAVLRAHAYTLNKRWSDLTEDLRLEIVQRLDRDTRRLRELAEETMTILRIDAQALPTPAIERRAVDLVREAADAADQMDGRLKMLVESGAEVALIRCDPVWLMQVFGHLIRNADRYSTPHTQVVLQLASTDEEVSFSIQDQGPGISAEDAARLFHLRSPGSGAGTEAPPGHGLGLYICRRIVEAHGGRVWVQSDLGQGSTFGFAIPRAKV